MSEERMVKCRKLGKELPGLAKPPYKNELGRRIYEEVSKEAWDAWLKESVRFINTYRVDLASKEGQDFMIKQTAVYFGFEEGDLAQTAWDAAAEALHLSGVRSDLLGDVRALGGGFAAREAEDPDRYPDESVRELIAAGALSMPFPRELGGLGASLEEATELILAVAEASPSLALLVSMPIGLAGVFAGAEPAVPEAHKTAFAGQVARVAEEYRAGRIFAACNSEKGAGGAIAATKTSLERAANGELFITGEKILASFGRHADVFFSSARLPEGGVEIVLVDTRASGVEIRSDWDGFGMRSTESHSVRYAGAKARELVGYPGFLEDVQPFSWWWCLFAAIPLGCAASMLRALGAPAPSSPAVRLRLSEALMRFEAARAYLLETARAWRPGAGAAFRGRVTRAKTHAAQESVRICADLFALSGGRHFTRSSVVARSMADSFAGAALRPPLPLALDALIENFSLGALDPE